MKLDLIASNHSNRSLQLFPRSQFMCGNYQFCLQAFYKSKRAKLSDDEKYLEVYLFFEGVKEKLTSKKKVS